MVSLSRARHRICGKREEVANREEGGVDAAASISRFRRSLDRAMDQEDAAPLAWVEDERVARTLSLNGDAELRDLLAFVVKILEAIRAHPDEAKFRSLRAGNRAQRLALSLRQWPCCTDRSSAG